MHGDHLLVDMSVNDLADFVFNKNHDNKRVELDINGLEDTRDLFCFCLDLMCKGLVMLFGTENRVAVNDLSQDQFRIMCDKMRCVGIECTLKIIQVEIPPETVVDLWSQNFLNMQRIQLDAAHERLEDYTFNLQTLDHIYRISFKLLPRLLPQVPPRILA